MNNFCEKMMGVVNTLCRLLQAIGLIESCRVVLSTLFGKRIIPFKYKGNRLYINNDRSTLYHIGHSVNKLEKLAQSIENTNPKTIIVVVANCGLYSFFVGRRFPEANLYLFEPTPDLIEIIYKNLRGFHNFEVVEKAVLEKRGKVKFYINHHSQQTNSIDKESIEFNLPQQLKEVYVASVSLDDFCKDRNIKKIDVLKVDIQGTELRLLKGAEKTIKVTSEAFFEVTFLFKEAASLLNLLIKEFGSYSLVNEIIMGADLRFFRKNYGK